MKEFKIQNLQNYNNLRPDTEIRFRKSHQLGKGEIQNYSMNFPGRP